MALVVEFLRRVSMTGSDHGFWVLPL